MTNYHGIIVDAGLKNAALLKKLNVLSTQKVEDWILYKIDVKETKLQKVITLLKSQLKEKFYTHFYRDTELIVVFPDQIFHTTTNDSDWNQIVKHGLSKGIPREQLDFKPCRIQDETF